MIKSMNVFVEASGKYKDVLTSENGHFWSWAPTIYLDPYEITETYEEFNQALDSGSNTVENSENDERINDMLKNYPDYLNFKKGTEKWDSTKFFGTILARGDKEGGWGPTLKAVDNADVIYNEFYGAPTATMQDSGATLDKLTEETFIKIIAGEKGIDAFDEYVKTWNSLGGEKITKEVNEWYKNK